MSRYQDELIELAKKFDIQTDSKGKFHERVISALKFELSYKRSQILVVNS